MVVQCRVVSPKPYTHMQEHAQQFVLVYLCIHMHVYAYMNIYIIIKKLESGEEIWDCKEGP